MLWMPNLRYNNFIIAKLHKMNFNEQVDLFNNAECVVGLHGGGFANISFCNPISLANEPIVLFKSLASLRILLPIIFVNCSCDISLSAFD